MQALQLARGKADYRLMIDADEVANVHGEFQGQLTADAYLLPFEGDTDYHLPLLLSEAPVTRPIKALVHQGTECHSPSPLGRGPGGKEARLRR